MSQAGDGTADEMLMRCKIASQQDEHVRGCEHAARLRPMLPMLSGYRGCVMPTTERRSDEKGWAEAWYTTDPTTRSPHRLTPLNGRTTSCRWRCTAPRRLRNFV